MPLATFQRRRARIRHSATRRVNSAWARSMECSTNSAASELQFPLASRLFGGTSAGKPISCWATRTAPTSRQEHATRQAMRVEYQQCFRFAGQRVWHPVSMNPTVKPSTVQEYNLTLSSELPWHTGFQLSYIGNYHTNLLQCRPDQRQRSA